MTSSAWMLVRVGGMLRRSGPWSRLRFVGLLLATLALTAGLAAVALAHEYALLRDTRALSLQPVTAADRSQAGTLYGNDGFFNINDRPVIVISLWPLRSDAPLPPGVPRWPAPGEAVLSPVVAADLGASRADMFGDPLGTIGAEGLEVPGERRVYRRPSSAALDKSTMVPVSGFGVTRNGPFIGPSLAYATPRWQVTSLLVGALVVPALMALALAASVDGEARSRRTHLLVVLGAGPRHRLLVDLSEAWPPIVWGTLAGTGLILVTWVANLSLPWLDAQFRAADARRAWPWLLAAIVLGHLLALLSVLAVRRRSQTPRRPSKSRPQPTMRQPVQQGRVFTCFAAAAATVWLPAYQTSATTRTITYSAGVLLFAMTFPAVLGAVLAGAGASISAAAWRRGSVGSLLGGRRLELLSARTTRILLGVCGTILVLGQVQLWASVLGVQYRDALGVRAATGTAAVMGSPPANGRGISSFLQNQPPNIVSAWTWSAPVSNPNGKLRTVITGPCSALATLGSPCRHPELSPGFHSRTLDGVIAAVPGEVRLRRQDKPDYRALAAKGATLWLLSKSGDDLPIDRLQQQAFARVPGGLGLSSVGQDWVTAGNEVRLRGSWTVLWGSIGVLVLAIATAIALAGDVIASARSTTSLVAITDRRRWLLVMTAWQLGLPIGFAGVLSAAAYYVLPTGMRDGATYMTPSMAYVAFSALGAVLVGLILSAWAARVIARGGRQWRPGSDGQ